MTIDELRRRIDQLDERLVELLNQRAGCALEIGRLKHELGMEIYQPDRETEVLNHVKTSGANSGGPLEPEALVRLFERIIDEGRRLELTATRDERRPSAKAERQG